MDIDTVTVKNLVSRLNAGTLVLPNFQRDFVWDPEDWQSLMASLMMEYPVGMLLVGSRGESNSYQMKKPLSIPSARLSDTYVRRLGEADVEIPDEYDSPQDLLMNTGQEGFICDFLLDGQQRVSSIDLIFSNAFTDCPHDELSWVNRYRWFLNLTELGLHELDWKDLSSKAHSDVKSSIVKVEYRLTDEEDQDYAKQKGMIDLIEEFCTNNNVDSTHGHESILLPFDEIYRIDESSYEGDPNRVEECFTFDFHFADKLLELYGPNLRNKIAEREGRVNANGGVEPEFIDEFERRKQTWRDNLRDLLQSIPDFDIPVVKVPANDFERIAGIFSVINKTGVDLHIFDLLVAKTAEYGQTIRDAFKESVSDFNSSYTSSTKSSLSNTILEKLSDDEIQDYFKLSNFIGERDNISTDVDLGDDFPEKNRKIYAQAITLMSRIGKAIDNEDKIDIYDEWYETDFSDIRDSNNVNLARFIQSVLSLGDDWKFGDDQIISTPKPVAWDYAGQAALQLMRAMHFCSTRLGIDRYASLPYKQMLLVLACAMTDPVWEDITRDQGTDHWRSLKLEKWYWGSIFGGAYQRRQDARVCSDIPRVISYLSDADVRWDQISEFSDDEEDIRYEESPIRGTDNSRFESIFQVRGYSDESDIKNGSNTSLEKAICSFEMRDGSYDFRSPDNDYSLLHAGFENTGENQLQRDHIISIGAWNSKLGEDERSIDRNSQHPINCPLNFTYASNESNNFWSDENAFLKFDLFEDRDERPDSLFSDHSINEATLENEFRDHMDLLREGNASDTKLTTDLLDPLLSVRFESLKTEVDNLCDSVS